VRDVDAAPVAWREAGAGDAVVFLHGLGGSRTAWDPQLIALSDRRRCVAWDMPGYGASPPLERITFPGLARAVTWLLDAIGAEAAHLVGLSMGGMVALHAALEHPARVRSLAILDSSPAFGLDGTTDADAWVELRTAPLRDATPADLAPGLLASVAAPGASSAVIAEASVAMARISSQALVDAIRCLPTHDVRHRLAEIGQPTLVVCGELDAETPPSYSRYLAGHIPGARLAIVPGAGHLANLERPAEVNALLEAFLP
jgi:pimeloyl-ACP methyl ester carboxylesterase